MALNVCKVKEMCNLEPYINEQYEKRFRQRGTVMEEHNAGGRHFLLCYYTWRGITRLAVTLQLIKGPFLSGQEPCMDYQILILCSSRKWNHLATQVR